ncbi:hypothetical protein H6S82_18590 [Planktothrix sp. FACHB-1355]|uniref:hypothetical protein n=1 Tax=Planktothrix sp. FACHB-1355 TaxID=2692854 RepID=UPI00168AB4DF|nr:hypothetical protein [Planktothrix sp. FACHB-1355]MBD3560841.1 hypothetical protein [Planktothrix sp. FACHB-1355]
MTLAICSTSTYVSTTLANHKTYPLKADRFNGFGKYVSYISSIWLYPAHIMPIYKDEFATSIG